ncbi:hypothetical protein B0J13DRAFT_614074 [Dactylonectria estremocensis]|uniref:Chromo domain-containing protein n=1 Tax=Dactylonectria estremocensis TaxID=1079267 RepID=A0A9P9D398_9HYPO|nr:hypothetical protein B0J13DRAFT_614074 [Dactylonectria estremocensis]
MVLKLQAYNPATGKFESSSTGTSYQKPRHKGPGHRRTKPMAGPLYTSSEQSCDGSDSRTPPEPSSAAANELVDLTGDSIRPPSRQCNSQKHHNVKVADNRRGNEEDTVGLQVESNALIYSRGENLLSRESEGPGLNSSTTEHSDTNRGPTEIPTPANPPTTLTEQPSPSIVSSNHPLYPASPSQQDAVTQAAASQKTADQFFSQPDILGGDPNACQSQRVELSDEISITLTRTTSQETDSSAHHEILPSASKQTTTKRLRRGWATVQKDPNNISQPINTKNVNKTLVPRSARPATDTTDGEEIASMDQDFDSSISVSTTATYATSEHIEAAAAVSNIEMEWEIDGDLMGKEVIDGVVHYLVPWKPTLVPEHEISAPELIRSFEKKFQVRTYKQVKGARVTKKATAKHPKSKGRC